MKLAGKPISIAYAILLAGCAYLAQWQMRLAMFGMGESETTGVLASAFLIVTALGILGLAIAALGSWTRFPFFCLIAILGVVGVLPDALIFFKESMSATIWQYNRPWVAGQGIYGLVIDIVAGWLSWLRFRQLAGKGSVRAFPSIQ